ncbi:MAG: helix-turn-helix domain-containing protein [Bulleidia sp.]
MTIADRIQNLRKVKGISQEELADKIGVSRQTISKWESEQSVPDIDKVVQMSDYFGMTTDYLLKGIEETEEDRTSDAQVFSLIGLIVCFIGLFVSIAVWDTPVRSAAAAIAFVPYSLLFNLLQAMLFRSAPDSTPYPEIFGNSIALGIIGWVLFFALCIIFDCIWISKRKSGKE